MGRPIDLHANQRQPGSRHEAKVVSITSHNGSHYQILSSNGYSALLPDVLPASDATFGHSGVVSVSYQRIDKNLLYPRIRRYSRPGTAFLCCNEARSSQKHTIVFSCVHSSAFFDISQDATPYPSYLALSLSHPSTPTRPHHLPRVAETGRLYIAHDC